MKKRVIVLLKFLLVLSGCNAHNVPMALAANDTGFSAVKPEALVHAINFNVRPGVVAKVTLSETRIMVQTNNMPAVHLTSLNLPLFREWGSIYLLINDFNRDGVNDLAILNNTGRVGQKRCYSIYRYNPATGKFRTRKSVDRCFG